VKIGICMFLWTANVAARHRGLLEDMQHVRELRGV
jgi:hypothetical protein